MFLTYMDEGDLDEAARYARMAVRAYRRKHPRIPELLHDVAQLWVGVGSFGRAIPMLQRLLANRDTAAQRAWTLALLAHAAAGTGATRLYEETWSSCWALLDQLGSDGDTPRSLLELARAAARAKDWLRVSLASTRQAERAGIARDPHLLKEMAQLAALARSRGAKVRGGSGANSAPPGEEVAR
jgi:hypothetical protein